MGQTTVLLGAGASVDAGLPISSALTEKITRAIQDDQRDNLFGLVSALNQTLGAIIAHETRHGASPYDGIDVERVFSAIKMLAEKESLEIAPFVGSWNDSRAGGGKLPSFWDRRFTREVERALTTRFSDSLAPVFAEGVHALTKTGTDTVVYQNLMDAMVQKLAAILAVPPPEAFAYLNPLLALPTPISIATLNYDSGVEHAASVAGMHLDTGIEAWDGGFDWNWPAGAAGVRLLKLHGSMDWKFIEPSRRQNDGPFEGIVPRIGVRANGEPPAIIFGAREKLQAEGPFLAMLHEFSRWMRNTNWLIVVGYSFRDEHINVVIRDWLGNPGNRKLTIVDPAFPDPGGGLDSSFAQQLANIVKEGKGGGGNKYLVRREGAAAALPLVCALAALPRASAT